MAIIFIGTPAFAVPSLQRLVAHGYAAPRSSRSRTALPAAAAVPSLPQSKSPRNRSACTSSNRNSRDPAALDQVGVRPRVRRGPSPTVRSCARSFSTSGARRRRASTPPSCRNTGGLPDPRRHPRRRGRHRRHYHAHGRRHGQWTILAQRVRNRSEDNTGTLADKLAIFGASLLAETLPRWLSGDITPEPQDAFLATTTSLLRKEDGAIDWSRTAVDIWRQVRACNPWPAFTYLHGEPLHIWRAWPRRAPNRRARRRRRPLARSAPPSDAPPFGVQTGDGLLAVREAQRPDAAPCPPPNSFAACPTSSARA
jgi:hypothetical protein